MMENNKTAAVGEKSSVLLFHAAGIHTVSPNTPEEAGFAVADLAQKGYSIIFITERLYTQIPDIIEKYRKTAYPALIPIPEKGNATDYSMRHLRENMEKAIGTNIFEI